MRIAIRENLLRASELCESMSDVLMAAAGHEDSQAALRLLRMSDNALACSRAFERIANTKTKTAVGGSPTAVVEPPEPPVEDVKNSSYPSVQSEPKASVETMQV